MEKAASSSTHGLFKKENKIGTDGCLFSVQVSSRFLGTQNGFASSPGFTPCATIECQRI